MVNSIVSSACLRRSRHLAFGLVAAVTALVAGNTRLLAQADGPIAAYAFSETSSVTAGDSAGNGNDATLVNGPTWASGRFGGGLQLDGIDDVVPLPMTETLTFSSAFTVEAWIAPTMFDHERMLWWTPGARLTLRAEGTVVPVAMLTDGQVGFVSSGTLPVGTWSHVAVTYDGIRLRLFINGADAGSRAATGTLMPAPEAGMLGGASAFAGKIDELRFYRRALSQAEIRLDSATPIDFTHPLEVSAHTPPPNAVGVMQTAMTVTFSGAVDSSTITASTLEVFDAGNVVAPATASYDAATRTATLSPTSALTPLTSYTMRVSGGTMGVRDALGVPLATDLAWTFRTAAPETAPTAVYAFSEASGVTAVDSSGNDNAALIDGPTRTTGRFGRGLQLDGVDDAVQLPMTESLAFSRAFTFEAWIAPTTFGRERSLWRVPGAMLTLRAEGTVVPVAVLSDEQVGFVSSGAVPLDTWSHVAMTYDGSRLRLYINGADVGSRAATGTLVPASPQEAGILGGASAFAGTIDELRLYRRALSASEIAADMTISAEAVPPPSPAPPHIRSVSVHSSWFGHPVLVKGNNFGRRQGTSSVTISGTPAIVVAWSSSTIQVIVPAGVTAGPFVVTVDGTMSNAVTPQFHNPRKS